MDFNTKTLGFTSEGDVLVRISCQLREVIV